SANALRMANAKRPGVRRFRGALLRVEDSTTAPPVSPIANQKYFGFLICDWGTLRTAVDGYWGLRWQSGAATAL
ncbi:MAG: hypothetical protein AB1705_24900, partial [Verrucomicrobiota bacterium]